MHSVTMQWPFMLWALLVLPALVGVYWYLGMRKKPVWPGAAGTGFIPQATYSRLWALLMLAGITLILLSMTRPRAILLLPARTEAVMLVMDSSGSMRANDITPSRFEAAQTAARMFIERQPRFVKVGIVSASGTASVVQAPTADRDALYRSIDRLALQTGSALGSGVLIGLATLLPASGIQVDQILENGQVRGGERARQGTSPLQSGAGGVPKVKLEPGSNASAVMVLMSDGQGNAGPDLQKMAELAADLGVRIFTVGFGTPAGAILRSGGIQARVKLDEAALKKVAETTKGSYFQAATEADIARIYESLNARIVFQKHQATEVTAVPMMLGMLLVMMAAGGSFFRTGRVI